jgi:hypothetical protein
MASGVRHQETALDARLEAAGSGGRQPLEMEMNPLVTSDAQCDEVFFKVRPEGASITNVMDLKIGQTPARLAAPPISLEHLAAESLVRGCVRSKPRPFAPHGLHDVVRN